MGRDGAEVGEWARLGEAKGIFMAIICDTVSWASPSRRVYINYMKEENGWPARHYHDARIVSDILNWVEIKLGYY